MKNASSIFVTPALACESHSQLVSNACNRETAEYRRDIMARKETKMQTTPKVNGEPYYEDMSLAFSDCREGRRPMIANVLGVRFKLFPSGRADALPIKKKGTPKLPKDVSKDTEAERDARISAAVRDRLNKFFGWS